MLLKEIRYVFLAHIVNVAIPIVLIPLLVHRLGDVEFGKFVIATGTSLYFAYIVELGFNNVAIERFSSIATDEKKRQFMAILIIKAGLVAVVCIAGMSLYLSLFAKWGWNPNLAWVMVTPALTCIIYPAWLFIIEKRQKINFIIQFATKVLLLALTVLLVGGPGDAGTAVVIYSISTLVIALPFAVIWLKYVDRKCIPDRSEIYRTFVAGVQASGLAVRDAWSANGIAPIIGIFLHRHGISDFALAEKMVRALATPAAVIGSTVLSNHRGFSALFAGRRVLVRILVGLFGVAYLCCALGVWIICNRYYAEYREAVKLFLCMSLIVPFSYVSYVLLNLMFILKRRYLALTVLIVGQCAAVLLIAGVFGLFEMWTATAVSIPMVEGIALLFLFRKLRKAQPRLAAGSASPKNMTA